MRLVLTVAIGGALSVLAAGCGGEAAPRRGELETVEVTAQPDAEASLEGDSIARPVGMSPGGVAGELPAGFPAEVPLPSPSSLVGSSVGAREIAVTLVVDLPPERVEEIYRRQLDAAGFVGEPGGRFTGHGHALRFAVVASHEASRLTIRVARP